MAQGFSRHPRMPLSGIPCSLRKNWIPAQKRCRNDGLCGIHFSSLRGKPVARLVREGEGKRTIHSALAPLITRGLIVQPSRELIKDQLSPAPGWRRKANTLNLSIKQLGVSSKTGRSQFKIRYLVIITGAFYPVKSSTSRPSAWADLDNPRSAVATVNPPVEATARCNASRLRRLVLKSPSQSRARR